MSDEAALRRFSEELDKLLEGPPLKKKETKSGPLFLNTFMKFTTMRSGLILSSRSA
jgi:hypothetical protein